jgi:hypothetical protein
MHSLATSEIGNRATRSAAAQEAMKQQKALKAAVDVLLDEIQSSGSRTEGKQQTPSTATAA